MAHVIAIGQPVNEAERLAIQRLRDELPDDYVVIHNFEIESGHQVFEVDVAVLAPHALYIVDVKGTRGRMEVVGGKWFPEGRPSFHSPLAKARAHAKVLKDLLVKYGQARSLPTHDIYTDAAVILTAPDAVLVDSSGRDLKRTVRLADASAFFQDKSDLPHWAKPIGALSKTVLDALNAVSHEPVKSLRFGSWVVEDHLGQGPNFDEFRAHNELAGSSGRTVLLRVYRMDAYLPPEERERERARLTNAYQMLNQLPPHPVIVAARDFFESPDSDFAVLVTDDPSGKALTLFLRRKEPLTFDQKLRLAQDLLSGLAHAHAHKVVHRALSPAVVLVAEGGGARLLGFEYAREESSEAREHTVAHELLQEADRAYLAPEALENPSHATAKSDVFSLGVLLYELFTGELPWRDASELRANAGVFMVQPSEARSDLPGWLDGWLQGLCAASPEARPDMAQAMTALEGFLKAGPEEVTATSSTLQDGPLDTRNLPANYALSQKYRIITRLGKGSFGAVYSVVDTFGDVKRAVKLLDTRKAAVLDRLKQEYRTLANLPEHPRVVRVYDADVLPSKVPFLVFEFVEGNDIGTLLENGPLSAADVLALGVQTAEGLVHLHANNVFHCDIKPRNLMLNDKGVKLIDFNVAMQADVSDEGAGGTRRYFPPDGDPQATDAATLADRDVFALGVTLFEALSGAYPWDPARTPVLGKMPPSLTDLSGLRDLDPAFAGVIARAISPQRVDRFATASAFLAALQGITETRRPRVTPPIPLPALPPAVPIPFVPDVPEAPTALLRPSTPNTNPFVTHLATLYSQSTRSNSGTRGLSEFGLLSYSETALDRELLPAVLRGEYRLVIVTGNAGDGKTAFLQKLQAQAQDGGAKVETFANGFRFEWQGRSYQTNLDGSQDEADRSNDDVLLDFFAPYADGAPQSSQTHTRLIAINEGRLMDFLTTHAGKFRHLRGLVERGLETGIPAENIAVVNLNLRSVVATMPHTERPHPEGRDTAGRAADTDSIFDQQVRGLTAPHLWEACQSCGLKAKCYALHNARTFQDQVNGARVRERLRSLYTLVHLRGRLHITLRDLRSALAFTLTSGRDCAEIHDLHAQGEGARLDYLDGYYFNAWMGGQKPSGDRLLRELKVIDVALTPDPQLDRQLDFEPLALPAPFEHRSGYDQDILTGMQQALPRMVDTAQLPERFRLHRTFLAAVRRRYFFERRDAGWRDMIPYRAGRLMLELLNPDADLRGAKEDIIRALNRGEGLLNPALLPGQLALQVREVERGALRSYRVFEVDRMTLQAQDTAGRARFVEHTPTGLTLEYEHEGHRAALNINLDVLEMLERLNAGYVPSVEEREGRYLSLVAFKNILSSRPYQTVLLAASDDELYRISRQQDGRLDMAALGLPSPGLSTPGMSALEA